MFHKFIACRAVSHAFSLAKSNGTIHFSLLVWEAVPQSASSYPPKVAFSAPPAQPLSQGKSGNDCSLCPKSTKITGDMYLYVFFHIRVGGTPENYADPPFWGVRAPLFWSSFNYSKSLRDTKNIIEQKF